MYKSDYFFRVSLGKNFNGSALTEDPPRRKFCFSKGGHVWGKVVMWQPQV